MSTRSSITLKLILIVCIIVLLSGCGHSENEEEVTKTEFSTVSEFDMSTTLIKEDKIIPAKEAYRIMKEKFQSITGDEYIYEKTVDGTIGFRKNGETRYSFMITCSKENTDGFLPIDSEEIPDQIVIYDCTSKEPSVDNLALIISVLTDNSDLKTLKTELQKKKDELYNGAFPSQFAVMLNKKGFYGSSDIDTEGANLVGLWPDLYNVIQKQDPFYALLFLYVHDPSAKDVLSLMSEEQAKELFDYYIDHENEYFPTVQSLVEKVGLNLNTDPSNQPESPSPNQEKSNKEENAEKESVPTQETAQGNVTETEEIYWMATTLKRKQCTKDYLGLYSYNDITFMDDDSEWLDNPMNKTGKVPSGAFYRKMASCLENFDIPNSWESYSPHIIGYLPDNRDEFAELVDDLSSFIVLDHPAPAILEKLETVSCVDIVNEDNDYSVTISDLPLCAQEMGISQEMLGYIIAALPECGGENIEFDGITCTFDLSIF